MSPLKSRTDFERDNEAYIMIFLTITVGALTTVCLMAQSNDESIVTFVLTRTAGTNHTNYAVEVTHELHAETAVGDTPGANPDH